MHAPDVTIQQPGRIRRRKGERGDTKFSVPPKCARTTSTPYGVVSNILNPRSPQEWSL